MKNIISGNLYQKLSGKTGWIIIGLIAAGAIYLFMSRTVSSTAPEIVELTLRSIPVEVDEYVPTIEANFTRTPRIVSLTAAAPTLALSGLRETRQFAASAIAYTESASTGQSALQVVGPSNVEGCTDSPHAYRPGESMLRAELRVFFAQLVTPTEIVISESFNPGRIVSVVAVDVRGDKHTVYEGISSPSQICPYVRYISIPDAGYQTNALIITIESSSSTTLTQIDSVELAGISFN